MKPIFFIIILIQPYFNLISFLINNFKSNFFTAILTVTMNFDLNFINIKL